IDACVHHHWRSQLEVTDFMSAGWREHIGVPGTLPGGAGAMPILPAAPFRHPAGDYLATGARGGARPAADPGWLVRQALDAGRVELAVLSHDRGMFIPAVHNTHRASALARAINDRTIGRWFAADERLFRLVLVPNQTPQE